MTIGPTRSKHAQISTLVLPDADRLCHVVTGWDSTLEEIEAYDQTEP